MTQHLIAFNYEGMTEAEARRLSNAYMKAHFDSQMEAVVHVLGDKGYVDNFNAIDGLVVFVEMVRILRLGAIIHRLRHIYGIDIKTRRGKELVGCPSHLLNNTYYLIGKMKNATTYADLAPR